MKTLFARLRDPVFWIALSGICLRFISVRLLHFGTDDIAIYERALDLYTDGKLSPVGAAVVYSGTFLPGALQSLLMGVPLFFSRGLPTGPAGFLALWNSLAMILIYRWARALSPQVNRTTLALWILLCPWSLLFINLWNPSFLPVFSILFVSCLTSLEQNPGKFWPTFGAVGAIFATLQLHLSFVLLAALLGLHAIRHFRRLSWTGLLAGASTGSITLIPYWLHRPTETNSGGFFIQNIQIHFERILDYPLIILRFLAFSSAELTRFITFPGKGFGGNLQIIGANLWLAPLFSISLLGTIWIVGSGLQGLGRMAREVSWKPEGSLQLRATLTWAALGLLLASFLFSIKDPAAHTFWILLPLTFLPALERIGQLRATGRALFAVYVISGVGYSLLGYPLVRNNLPLHRIVQEVEAHYPRPLQSLGHDLEAATPIYRALQSR